MLVRKMVMSTMLASDAPWDWRITLMLVGKVANNARASVSIDP